MKAGLPLFSMLLLALAATPLSAEVVLEVRDAWIREAPPGAQVHAGYLDISNHGTTDTVLTGISSEDFGAVEIHRTVIEDGVARMLSVERLAVPAGGMASLAPGGYHLMLFRPARALAAGDTAGLLLHFSDGVCRNATAVVRRSTGDGQP